MKLLLIILSLGITTSCDNAELPVESPILVTEVVIEEEVVIIADTLSIESSPAYILDINPLISAMILVESGGNDSAYCKSEEAVGCLQIRPIMLRECNRILKLKKSSKRYTLVDRWDRVKSIEIFHIVNQHHNKIGTYEAIARSWNGGPKWAKKSNTKRYWRKVKRQIKKLVKEDEYSYDWLAQL